MESEANTATVSPQPENFEFTGKAGEYFSIWIVNVLLTILTLGIYSAWAKVRTNQYFYGNTKLNGNTFRYLADPKQILKGRMIAVTFFAVYYFSGLISPAAAGISLLILVLLMPALIVMSMSFQLRNTAYRNIKFKFEKNFKKAYMVFILPMLILGPYFIFITLFQPEELATQQEIPRNLLIMIAGFPLLIMLMFPWWEYMITGFKINHSNFGTSDFAFTAKKRQYYFLYLKPFFGIMLVGILFAVIAGAVEGFSQAAGETQAAGKPQTTTASPIITIAMPFAIIVFYLWFFAYIQTKRTNLIFNNINIEGHQLTSNLGVAYMMYLYATNTLAMALSLGLLMPWAKIRTARYRASVTAIEPAGDFDGFISAQSSQQSALGEEMGEIFDLDLGM
jgi:uncharacterized membrane protein YjgN (DUF898 family)